MTPMPPTDDRLEAVLASIGEHLDLGPRASAPGAFPPPHRRTRDRFLAAAAAVLVIIVLAVATIAPARDAVADFLRIGSTRIDRAPLGAAPSTTNPSTAPAGLLDALERIDAATATTRLGRSLPDTRTTVLGPPDAIYAMRSPEEGVVLAWTTPEVTLWVHRAPVSDAIIYAKQLGAANRFEILSGLGDSALAITGPHTLRTPDRTIAAGNVVLWIRAGWELRLEADRPITELADIARTIRS